MSFNEDMRKSIISAMMARGKNSELYIHMVNGEKITLSPKAFPLSLEEDSIMHIADGDKGRLSIVDLDYVVFVECYVPKNGEPSNMPDVLKDISKVRDVDQDDSKLNEIKDLLFEALSNIGDDE